MGLVDRTYLLIGHVTKDLLPNDGFTIGGTVTYASVVARQLGWTPVIITTAGPDFTPPAYLTDVTWHVLPSPATTTFRNEYTPQGRQQTIGPIALPIRPEDVPPSYRHTPLVHLCPLDQELEPRITTAFNSHSRLLATPQGWLRYWDASGVVSLGDWRQADQFLPNLEAAVISIEDVEGDWSLAEKWAGQLPILVVTEAERGCTVFNRGSRQHVPPRPSQPAVPTGAGDVFAAAFFMRLHEIGQVWQAARFANVTASMAIERPGPENAPHRHEIETYLAETS